MCCPAPSSPRSISVSSERARALHQRRGARRERRKWQVLAGPILTNQYTCGGDGPSHRGVDGATATRSVSLGHRSSLCAPRPRSRIRPMGGDGAGHGHERPPHGAALPVAERVRRTVFRIRAARVPRSRHRVQRVWTPTADAAVLRLLPTIAHASLARQRSTAALPDRAAPRGPHCGDPAGRRPASSVRTARRLTRRGRHAHPAVPDSTLADTASHRDRTITLCAGQSTSGPVRNETKVAGERLGDGRQERQNRRGEITGMTPLVFTFSIQKSVANQPGCRQIEFLVGTGFAGNC